MNTDEVDEDQRKADGQTSEIVGGTIGFRRCSKHDEDEDAGKHNLDNQSVAYSEGTCVGTCSGGDNGCWLCSVNDKLQQGSGDNGADHLEDHVHAAVLRRHTSREEAAKGDGRIDVAS